MVKIWEHQKKQMSEEDYSRSRKTILSLHQISNSAYRLWKDITNPRFTEIHHIVWYTLSNLQKLNKNYFLVDESSDTRQSVHSIDSKWRIKQVSNFSAILYNISDDTYVKWVSARQLINEKLWAYHWTTSQQVMLMYDMVHLWKCIIIYQVERISQ